MRPFFQEMIEGEITAASQGPALRHHGEGQLAGRPRHHRAPLQGLPGGRPDQADRPGHLLPDSRRSRPLGEYHRPLDRRPASRAQPDLQVRVRRQAPHLDGQRRLDAAQTSTTGSSWFSRLRPSSRTGRKRSWKSCGRQRQHPGHAAGRQLPAGRRRGSRKMLNSTAPSRIWRAPPPKKPGQRWNRPSRPPSLRSTSPRKRYNPSSTHPPQRPAATVGRAARKEYGYEENRLLTSGGDCQGLNPAMRGVTETLCTALGEKECRVLRL